MNDKNPIEEKRGTRAYFEHRGPIDREYARNRSRYTKRYISRIGVLLMSAVLLIGPVVVLGYDLTHVPTVSVIVSDVLLAVVAWVVVALLLINVF